MSLLLFFWPESSWDEGVKDREVASGPGVQVKGGVTNWGKQ